jgi:hypothetical protein
MIEYHLYSRIVSPSIGERYQPMTFRQTQVIVIPSNDDMRKQFVVFDSLVQAINAARRQARDYITDTALEKVHDRLDDEEDIEKEWSVSVNCAHLHPGYGKSTTIDETDDDPEYIAYQRRKIQARRSPYPTLVLEVRSQPPPNFGMSPPQSPSASSLSSSSSSSSSTGSNQGPVHSSDIARLEALFGKSAHMQHPTHHVTPEEEEEAFYQALGKSINQVTSVTPISLAQRWLTQYVSDLPPQPALVESSTPHVDTAYEFVFNNLAMMKHEGTSRHYLVMPHFLSSSATSAEKFAKQVNNILQTLPEWKDTVQMAVYHPEHIDATKRAPLTIFQLDYTSALA